LFWNVVADNKMQIDVLSRNLIFLLSEGSEQHYMQIFRTAVVR